MVDKRHKYVRLLPIYSLTDEPSEEDKYLIGQVGKIIDHQYYAKISCGVVIIPGCGKFLYPLADMESITKKEYFIGALGG